MAFRWYTRARKFPQLIGRTPDGTRIPGGPYTYTQVGVGVVMVIGLSTTTGLWAHAGLLANAIFAITAVAGAIFMAGKLPPGMRNPMILGGGLARLVSSRGFTVDGERIRVAPVHRPSGNTAVFEEAPIRVKEPAEVRAAVRQPTKQAKLASVPVAHKKQIPTTVPVQPKPSLSAVQRHLLGEAS